MSSSVSTSAERFTGRVKWFNNKAGYGFITTTDGSMSGKDVFVHHSSIKVDSEQYKYLVQGEYVDFMLSNTTNTNGHEYQAEDVCGIKGGKLMCETRRESRVSRSQYRVSSSEQEENSEPVKMPRPVSAPKERRQPDRRQSNEQGKNEWTYVSKTRGEQGSQTQNQRTFAGRGQGQVREQGREQGRGRC